MKIKKKINQNYFIQLIKPQQIKDVFFVICKYIYNIIFLFICRENRMKQIENLTWKMTGELPEHIENKLDEKDKIYYQKYNQLINRYSKTISESEFNLTKDYVPVKDIIVEVRALENIKNVPIDSGKKKLNLIKNHTYTLRKYDIEHYLRRGMLVINE